MNWIKIILFICIQPLLIISCALFQSDIDTVVDLLPRNSDLSGWNRTIAPSEYNSNSVKRYNINYDNTGIEKLSYCEFFSDVNENNLIRVEILRFDSIINAYGFFSSKRGEGKFELKTVNEFYNNLYAVAQRGEYIIYVYVVKGSGAMKDVCAGFLNISIKNISENYNHGILPSKAGILLADNKYGVIYSIKEIEKPDDINEIYYTNWIYDSRKVLVFISERKSFADSYELLNNKINKGYIISEAGREHTAFIKTADGTYNFVSIKDRWIYGCCYAPDIKSGKRIIDDLRIRIMPYLR